MKISKRQLKRIIKEALEDISFIRGDLLDLASRSQGVTLDEINELYGEAGFEIVDDLSADGIVWLDDQEGVVYASGSQPSAGLGRAVDRYTR